ncbi:MAG: FKBP-type peptidyl-prolyl cis-trans isomerase [Rikenellaceae bacterium]|nr:FKBP-type peptidyl-prolyl cis-trans isomerase [Rikenellaceae bacterium]
MNKFFAVVTLLLISVFFLPSCAKEKSEDNSENKYQSFLLWMNKYHPDVEMLYDGVFLEWLERGPGEVKLYEGYWIKIDYTGRTLDGSIYVTRDKSTAQKLGIFSTSNYYAPEYLPFFPGTIEAEYYASTANMAKGQAEVLKLMSEGDSVRLYLYADQAYPDGYSLMSGYAVTSSSVSINSSVIIDMKLSQVVPDPLILEKEMLGVFVIDSLGMDLEDYTEEGLYIKKTLEVPDSDYPTEEELVSIYYTGRLLDGFIFDTNDKYEALANGTYDPSEEYSYYEFYPNEDADVIEGMRTAILNMRYGEKARVVFLSKFGYGESGGGAAIPPYSPLVFDIHLLGPDDF